MLGLFVTTPNDSSGSSAKIRWRFIVCFSLFYLVPLATGQAHLEKELRRDILQNYNKSVAPAFEGSATDFYFHYFSHRIREFDESTGTLTLEAGMYVNWMDTRLSWNDNPKYQNITAIRNLAGEIWRPSIKVFNSGRREEFFNIDNLVTCTNDGDVYWGIRSQLHPACTLQDLSWYPSDTHVCTLSLGSLHPQETDSPLIDDWTLKKQIRSLHFARSSPQWDILKLEYRDTYTTAAKDNFYRTTDFIFTIRRRGMLLLVTFLPLMLCSIFLSWSSFALPLHGKQQTKRLSVATCSLYLSSVILLVMINTVTGVGQKPPIIVRVNVCVVIMAFLTSLHVVVVSRVSRKSTTHLNALQKLPGPVQYMLGLHQIRPSTPATSVAGANSLLANMESSSDSGQESSQRGTMLEDKSELVEVAYDRAHLILQIIIFLLVVAFLCLV